MTRGRAVRTLTRVHRAPKVCVDVDYRDDCVVAACVGFHAWTDDQAAFETKIRSESAAAAYEPGQFYRREMPYVLGLLERLDARPAIIVVDGYVTLDQGKPGFGAHLHQALSGRCAVVGVAKRPFRNATSAVAVLRGTSHQPLFVDAIGVPLDEAVDGVRAMHGAHRVPTLLKRVDRLSRS
ncbi:endonuclease V [Pendulispora albinea]|uniref:Endonuclease V n=1 Tax=Pendulispora albinea TaxID=2741071 RepID=A0ABZ2LZ30_9BACT